MKRKLPFGVLIASIGVFMLPSMAQLQEPPLIRAGETVEGRLESTMPQLPNGSHFRLYHYEG